MRNEALSYRIVNDTNNPKSYATALNGKAQAERFYKDRKCENNGEEPER